MPRRRGWGRCWAQALWGGWAGGGPRLPWRCSVGQARLEQEPCLRHAPGFRLQKAQAAGTAWRRDLSSLHGPFLSRSAWNHHSRGRWALLWGPDPAWYTDAFSGGPVSAPSSQWRQPREQGPPGNLRPPHKGPWSRDADLQVGDVPVDVHGGRHAALGDVLVVAGAGLAVHGVDAGDGDALVAASDVSAREGALLLL